MNEIAVWLGEMMKPLVARVLTAMGLSMVTVQGVSTALDEVQSLLLTNLQNVPSAGLKLAELSGAGIALGLVLGAVAFRMLLWSVAKTVRLLGGGD